MRYFAIFTICILKSILAVRSEGKYTIVGREDLHSGRKYNVVVGVHHTTQLIKLKLGITGSLYNEVKTIDLQPNEVKNIEFDIPELNEGDYNLTAEGVQGIIFKKTTSLKVHAFRAYLKIETDRLQYEPGEWINFRVLFIDENLRPYHAEKDALIWLEDGERNRIKEFKNFEVIKGVYTDKFQLSEFPVLGSWRLVVNNGGRHPSNTYFTVSKNVLPKFRIKVEFPKHVSVRDGYMHVVVRVYYTNRKPLGTKVTLNIQSDEQPSNGPVYSKTSVVINGTAKLDLNLKENYLTRKKKTELYILNTTVVEESTGIELNEYDYFRLHRYQYNMIYKPIKYETSKEMDVGVGVQHVDLTIPKDQNSLVKLTYKEYPMGPKNKVFTFESNLNETGIATFKVPLTDMEHCKSHIFQVNVQYADESQIITYITTSTKRKKTYEQKQEEKTKGQDYFKLQVIYPANKYFAKLNEPTVLSVNSITPLTYFVYNIVGRGNILHSERIEVIDNAKQFNITVTPTFSMAPHAQCYIYYVDEHGELHDAVTTLYIEFELQNQIEITAPERVKPGEDVTLRIKTAPNSFVGLVAVDQRIQRRRFDINPIAYVPEYFDVDYTVATPKSCVVALTNADYFNKSFCFDSTLNSDLPKGNDEERNINLDSFVPTKGFTPRTKETWIFDNIANTETEEFTWSKKIPETITSWVIEGFSLNPEKGLGVTGKTTGLRTFQPFFISIRLPYAVKRGEVINVPALVFNYLEKGLDVVIILDNLSNEFEFTKVPNKINEQKRKEKIMDCEVILNNSGNDPRLNEVCYKKNEPKRSRTIRVPANSNVGVSFMLRAQAIGNIMLKYTAISQISGDTAHKTLKVLPEGVTEYANRVYFVNFKSSPAEFKETFKLAYSSAVVPDSAHIEFRVYGDLLTPILHNLNNWLHIPTDCGEPTTSTLVVNYLALRYLKNSNKLTPALESTIKHNLESAYQNILDFQSYHIHFRSFKEIDSGSIWLTAYVIRALQEAKQHINIDKKILQKGLSYLASQQATNGSFVEEHSRDHVALTAQVLLAFIVNMSFDESYGTNIEKGLNYVLENIEKTDDLYVKAIATYVLNKAKHPKVVVQLEKLKSLAKFADDRMWWSENDASEANADDWWRRPSSKDIEITSYILLTLLDQETETVETVLPIAKWLVAQRNSYGGFSSTRDTVVGLQALIKFAEKLGSEATVIDIEFTAKGDIEKHSMVKVNKENGLLLQSEVLPQKTYAVDFLAQGEGVALIEITYHYNTLERAKSPSFIINTVINNEVPPLKLEINICVEYTGDAQAPHMAVLEIALPSGYVANLESIKNILAVEGVGQTETKNSNSVIVVYFESLHKHEMKCLPVEAFKSFAVALQKPVPIVAYDYYDASKKATVYYEVISQMCDNCEDDEECKKACTKKL